MYARALITGEIEAVNKTKYNSTGRSREEAFESINNAEPVYLQDSDLERISQKIKRYEDKIDQIKNLKPRDRERMLLEKQIKRLQKEKEISLLKRQKNLLEEIKE